MTVEQGWEDAAQGQEQGPDAWGEMQPIPVVVHSTLSERVAPEAVSMLSVPIPLAPNVAGTGTAQPAVLCPHAYQRYKAKFTWTIPANCIVYVSKTQNGLMGNALANAYQIIVGATPITNSTVLMPEYDGQSPLYAVATVAGAQCSVMDEIYKTVQ